MRSAMSITRPMSCSTSSIEMPSSWRMSRMNRAMSSVSSWFIPATGSSSSSSSGSMASARPSSTRFWNPYGSSDTGCLRHCSISRKSMMSSTRRRLSSSSFLAGPHHSDPASQDRCIRAWRPSSRLSMTVICGNSSMFWNVRAMPSPATLSGRRPLRLRALPADVADLGDVHLADRVEDRRLAGPVGADDREQLALVDRERDVVDREDAAEAELDPVDLEQRAPGPGRRHDSHLFRRL